MIDSAELLRRARAAAEHAYVPYSRFRVGAAVRVGEAVFTGCNVENASYGLSICAERNAIFQAVAAGHRRIDALALSCVDASPEAEAASLMPCGACRQVLREFVADDAPITIDGVGTVQPDDLLPNPFRL